MDRCKKALIHWLPLCPPCSSSSFAACCRCSILFVTTATIYGIVTLAPAEARAKLYTGKRTRVGMPLERERRTFFRDWGRHEHLP